jgi:hypothetical protein
VSTANIDQNSEEYKILQIDLWKKGGYYNQDGNINNSLSETFAEYLAMYQDPKGRNFLMNSEPMAPLYNYMKNLNDQLDAKAAALTK